MDALEFRKALEALENGSELVSFFENAVSAEKNRGINEYRSVNSRLKKYKEALDRLGYDGVADVDEFTSTLLDTVECKTTQGSTELSELQSNLKKLQRSFEQAQGELKVERDQRESLQKQNKIKTIEGKMIPKLNEDLYGAQYVVKSLIADGVLDMDENGEIILKNGDQVLTYEDGVKHILNTNTDARRNKQVAGAGTSGTNGTKGKVTYTMDQIKNMTPEEYAANAAELNKAVNELSK
jgi:hypothetical protein